MNRFTRKNWFTISLLFIPFIAYLANSWGFDHEDHSSQLLSKAGVAIIFFLSGLTFKRHIFYSTLGNWKLHLFTQSFCYLFIPFLVFLLIQNLPQLQITPYFSLGILILACMPTTISSCVVMTGLAKGNESGALFNGVLSNLMGIFICPFLVSFYVGIQESKLQLNPLPILQSLIFLVLIPMLLGITTLYFTGSTTVSHWGKKIRFSNSFIILVIVYVIFFDTFDEMQSLNLNLLQLAQLALQLLLLHILIFFFAFSLGVVTGFPEKDLKAFILTAPQKTLALGMPLTMAILQNQNLIDESHAMTIALPLAVYHHLQLIFAGIFLRFKKYIFPRLYPF